MREGAYTALSASPNLRAHRQYIHMCPTSSIDICWFFLTDRLVPTVPDRSGARVLFSWVVPDDQGVSVWHRISSVRCKQCLAMFVLLVMVAQSHPATMIMTGTPVLALTLLVAVPCPGARLAMALPKEPF